MFNYNGNGILQEIIEQNLSKTGFWDELSEKQQKELEIAIKESYNKKNVISHDEVYKKYRKWLER